MTNQSFRYWLVLHPDIDKPIGGVKQMHRLAEALTSLGRKATVIQDKESFHPQWFTSQVSVISYTNWKSLQDLSSDRDIVIFPETYMPVIAKYASNLPKVIFNQNASYSFGLPSSKLLNPVTVLDLYKDRTVIHVLCVSKYDKAVLVRAFGLGQSRVTAIPNALETDIFKPSGVKSRQIAYMPRKNNRDSSVVKSLLCSHEWFNSWALKSIQNCSQDEVASILQKSSAFLSFGYPEGFGLPVAEAMACGCAVAGYSGLGGRELFEIGRKFGCAYEINYGDWLGFVDAVRQFTFSWHSRRTFMSHSLQKCSSFIRRTYNFEAMLKEVSSFCNLVESSIKV